MIGRWTSRIPEAEVVKPKGFDDFDLRLGDLMRGERATLGKSLLDVQRELRIRANYIAAIENCDPSVFDTPGFISGYVRSYARYLGLDPDDAFDQFCAESGFSLSHGMAAEASTMRKGPRPIVTAAYDPFTTPSTPFAPAPDSWFSRIEPSALGSVLVLVALIGTLGYGGWTVLNEVQRVKFAPINTTPSVLSDLDPLRPATQGAPETLSALVTDVNPPSPDALDRLYRPPALDVPVLVARDAPIASLDRGTIGTFADAVRPVVRLDPPVDAVVPQVNDGPVPELVLVAVRPAWVRVSAADGSVIYEGIMESGARWTVPALADAPLLRVGESGAIYFAVNGQHYGPAGARGTVTSNLSLQSATLAAAYALADPAEDRDLARSLAALTTPVTAD